MMNNRPPTDSAQRFPWQEGRACREDRAMGLELELIELVHRREIAEAVGDPLAALDAAITATMTELASEAADPLVA